MPISTGRVSTGVLDLIEKVWLKARNFKNSNNKIADAYVFTPKGVGEKAKLNTRSCNARCVNTRCSRAKLKSSARMFRNVPKESLINS